MRSILQVFALLFLIDWPVTHATAAEIDDTGIITITTAGAQNQNGDVFLVSFDASRWGMYSVEIELAAKAGEAGPVDAQLVMHGETTTANVAWKTVDGKVVGAIPRAYVAKAGKCDLKLTLPGLVGAITSLRLTPAPEGTAELALGKDGKLVLPAKEATVFGRMLRYEPNPKKLCLGFWTNKNDYARWTARIDSPGTYDVTVFQGCGKPNGGSKAEVVLKGGDFEQKLPFAVAETGGFQDFVPVKAGQVKVPALKGPLEVEIHALDLAKAAVMDVQKIVLTKID